MRKKLSVLVAIISIFAVFSFTVQAARWETGCFGKGTSFTSVHEVYAESQKYWVPFKGNRYKAKTPTVRFYSYRGDGKEQKGTTMYVMIRRYDYKNKKWTLEFDYKVKSGQKIKLNLLYPNKADYTSEADVHNKCKWQFVVRRISKDTDVKWWAIECSNGIPN